MELIAVGFRVMIAGATVLGIFVGAVGGAVVWRLRIQLALGGLLTALAYLLLLVVEHPGYLGWLRTKLTWGIPSTLLAFLICSISASWLEAHTRLRRTWTSLAALGLALIAGSLYLFLFRVGMRAPVLAGLVVDLVLIVFLIRNRTDAKHA